MWQSNTNYIQNEKLPSNILTISVNNLLWVGAVVNLLTGFECVLPRIVQEHNKLG
jgi:hypothetical protein